MKCIWRESEHVDYLNLINRLSLQHHWKWDNQSLCKQETTDRKFGYREGTMRYLATYGIYAKAIKTGYIL